MTWETVPFIPWKDTSSPLGDSFFLQRTSRVAFVHDNLRTNLAALTIQRSQQLAELVESNLHLFEKVG